MCVHQNVKGSNHFSLHQIFVLQNHLIIDLVNSDFAMETHVAIKKPIKKYARSEEKGGTEKSFRMRKGGETLQRALACPCNFPALSTCGESAKSKTTSQICLIEI